MTSFELFGTDEYGEVGVWQEFDEVGDLAISLPGGRTYLNRDAVEALRNHLSAVLAGGKLVPPSRRVPTGMWRVISTGDRRDYWQPGSKNYAHESYARSRASEYRRMGATDVRVIYSDTTWIDVTDKEEKPA